MKLCFKKMKILLKWIEINECMEKMKLLRKLFRKTRFNFKE